MTARLKKYYDGVLTKRSRTGIILANDVSDIYLNAPHEFEEQA